MVGMVVAAGFVFEVVLGNGFLQSAPAGADVGAAKPKDKPAMAGGANAPVQAAATANAPARQSGQAPAPVRAAGSPETSAKSAASVGEQSAAAAPEYPPIELVAGCGLKAAEIRRQYGAKLNVAAYPPFVIAGDMPVAQLDSYAKLSVVRPARAMWAAYFDKKPDQVLTTFLFAGQDN